jgi:SprT protein
LSPAELLPVKLFFLLFSLFFTGLIFSYLYNGAMQSTRRRDLKIKVNQRIDELDEMTTRKWGSGAVPEVSLDYGLKGHVGGRANYLKEEIQINYYLLDKYEDDYIQQTIGHEYAHLVAFKVYGRSILGKPHGKAWKYVMRCLGMEPKRCHNYETKAARRTRTHSCECNRCGKKYELSTIRYNRILRGYNYYHPKCGGKIEPVMVEGPKMYS